MNADRRKQIAKAQGMISEAQSILDAVASEERDAFDNMPESLQSSDRGQKTDEYATKLEEMRDALEEMSNEDFSD